MRTPTSPVRYFDFCGASTVKVVQEYRVKYQALSDLLDENPRVLAWAHRDRARLLSTSAQGRGGGEGSISGLKRAFKRGKCLFKGFKPCAAGVGWAVLCHNLVLLTRW